MIAALKHVEVYRKHEYEMPKHMIFAWKLLYGGMDLSEAQEAWQLLVENSRPEAAGPPESG